MGRYIDGFCGTVSVSKGKSVVLVVVDRLSKYAHFIPLSHLYTAIVVAQIFFDQVFKLHGIPRTIYCYNISWHSAIKATPFKVVYGQPPPSLLTDVPGTAKVESIERQLLDRDQKIKELRATLKEAQNRIKKVYDSTLSLRKNLKLSSRYYGSYQIVKRIRAVAYKLDLLEESRIHQVFHVSLLKKKVGEGTLVQTELPPVHEANETLHPKPQAVRD
ncbi:hypothetical protein AMTRI_Chr12g235220 [Amborella trichopoda]